MWYSQIEGSTCGNSTSFKLVKYRDGNSTIRDRYIKDKKYIFDYLEIGTSQTNTFLLTEQKERFR
jgi:hypothetical protein